MEVFPQEPLKILQTFFRVPLAMPDSLIALHDGMVVSVETTAAYTPLNKSFSQTLRARA
jgi:hypothetical protein